MLPVYSSASKQAASSQEDNNSDESSSIADDINQVSSVDSHPHEEPRAFSSGLVAYFAAEAASYSSLLDPDVATSQELLPPEQPSSSIATNTAEMKTTDVHTSDTKTTYVPKKATKKYK